MKTKENQENHQGPWPRGGSTSASGATVSVLASSMVVRPFYSEVFNAWDCLTLVLQTGATGAFKGGSFTGSPLKELHTPRTGPY